MNVQVVCCDCCEEGTLFDESGYDFTSVDMMFKSYLSSLAEEPSHIFLYVDYDDDYKNKWEKSNCTLEEFMKSHSHCVVLQVIECE